MATSHGMKWILAALLFTVSPEIHAGTAPPVSAPAKTAAQVVGVQDGDTLTAMMAGKPVKIRLEGIDAPEKRQAFGNAAKDALAALVAGRTVHLAATGKDRYGRTLARVYADGKCVNLAMVRQGMAWHFLRYNKDADLAAAESAARKAKRGLWTDKNAVAPWDWRKGGRITPNE